MILALLRCLWPFTSMNLFTGRSLEKNISNIRKYSWKLIISSFHQPLNASGESLINVWLINKWNRFQFDSGTQWSAGGVTGWRPDREDCLQSKVHHHRREVRDGHIGNASSSGDPFYRFHDPEDFLKDARIHYFWFINTVNYGQTPTVN